MIKKTHRKFYLRVEDLANVLGIEKNSARVVANWYVKKDIILRLKKDFHVLREKWIQAIPLRDAENILNEITKSKI